MNGYRATALCLILVAVVLLAIDTQWARARRGVVQEAERHIVRHDLDHEKGEE
jgi:hypothetical protein